MLCCVVCVSYSMILRVSVSSFKIFSFLYAEVSGSGFSGVKYFGVRMCKEKRKKRVAFYHLLTFYNTDLKIRIHFLPLF